MKRTLLLLVALFVATLRPHQALAAVATVTGDAYTNSGLPNTKLGTATTLTVKGPPAASTTSNVYMQFDLSSLPAGTIGADVGKATVTVFVNTVTTAGSFDVFRVTSAWTEATIKANAAPTLAGTPEVSGVALATTDKNDFKTVDVTQLVKDWLNNVLPNNGVALVPNVAGVSAVFQSKENTAGGHVAQLDIELSTVTNFRGNLSGDVTGTQTNTTVGRINNSPLGSLLGATSGKALTFNGTNWSPSNVVNSVTAGSGVSVSGATGNVTLSVPNGGVSNSMLANSSVTVSAGTGLSGGGAVALGASTTLNNAGVLSVNASAPLASSGGQSPSVSLTGTVPVANGGTGSSTASGARGNLGAAASGANSDITSLSGITGNITLPATGGNILKGSSLFVHNSGANNTFVGEDSGNLSVTGINNTAVGRHGLGSNSSGAGNTAVGSLALWQNNTGSSNSALGHNALVANTTGYSNTAGGDTALGYNTTGSQNTALGAGALAQNTAADNNTAVGSSALSYNTIGTYNTAAGEGALLGNTSGDRNAAFGASALQGNSTGAQNTAVGFEALMSTSGSGAGIGNTAVGIYALEDNDTGYLNAAVGYAALGGNTTGAFNTAVGNYALANNTTGYSNIAVGSGAGYLTTGSNNIDVGNSGLAAESNTIRIGTVGTQTATYIAGINGATSSGGVAVLVNASGQLGTITSSARFKDNIEDMGDSTSALMKLRPVRFRYKRDIDPSGLEQYGLVAEEVAKVYPDLVVYDDKGRPQTVRYHFINAMLLNEVQKQARKITAQRQQLSEQRQQVTEQAHQMGAQAQQIEVLTAQARQASAQAQQIEALTARLVELEASVNRHAPALEASYRKGAGL